jgi:hypothetical protein
MKTKIIVILILLGFAGIAKATIVDISVATDKSTYQLGEYVTVSITAYNPNPQPVTLHFNTTLQATYLMDSTFNWTQCNGSYPMLTERTIDPFTSYTWNHIHDSPEMMLYPLDIGIHTVVGEVVGYGVSTPVQFEVVPEPGTLAIFAFALPIFRYLTRRKICDMHQLK